MKFEPNSFKLTHEMVVLMGGADSQGFKMFSELVVKGFLALRPYAEDIISVCHLMLKTDLPSFKGEPTIDRLRDRFKLELTERQAAKWAEGLIANGFENGECMLGFLGCREP
jgi:phosphatidylinositol 4-kinase A